MKKTPQTFIGKHPGFIWWVPDTQSLDDSAIVEATLSYGHMEDKKELLSIMGRENFRKEFKKISENRRSKNIEPRTLNYWTQYLSR